MPITPPDETDGVAVFGCSVPPIEAFPVRAGWTCCACAVMVTADEACVAFHVALQFPLWSDSSARAGSPDENDTVTLPSLSGFPQSSTTVTSIAVGQPALTVKPVPSAVKTGRS